MDRKKKKQQLSSVDQPIYGYWRALYSSFFSQKLYVDVAKRWKGYGALYVLFIIALAAIPYSLRIITNYNQKFDEHVIFPLKEMPPLLIQKGIVSLKDKLAPMPYFIKNKQNQVLAIIDTTGSITKIDKTYPELTWVITKDTLNFRPPRLTPFVGMESNAPGSEIEVQAIRKNDTEIFSGEKWLVSSGMLKLKYVPMFLVYPIITSFSFVLYFIFFIMLAMLGQVFSKVLFDFKITYKQACRIFAVAATPQIIFFFFIITTNLAFLGLGFIYVAILTIYFSYAIVALKRSSGKLVHA